MLTSKSTSPHAFSVVEVDYHNVDLTRSKVKKQWKDEEGFSLTYLPFISRAVVDALDEFPHLNASVGDSELIVHGYVDLGIAVDLDYEGLIVPVIRGADGKRLGAIAKEIYDLAGRARTKKLMPDEISGGTFTISNNGSAGSVLTFPIINQPQVAILSTDAIVRKPVVAALPDGTEAIVVHPVGNLAMAWDHRAFDGAYAAGFLVRVKEILEIEGLVRPSCDVRRCGSRWLGSVPYGEALAVQEALFRGRSEQHLLLLEHPHVFTYGPRSDLAHNLRCEPADVGAELVAVSRGGDITYHGPGQLVGYPILTVANKLDAAGHVRNVEQVVIDTLAAFGVSAGRLTEYPGVWVDADGPNPRKICAIGVRLKGGRTMHGFALNVATDMAYLREHIVACGIGDRPVTSLREEGVDVEMREVVDVLARIAGERWGHGRMERQDVAWRHRPEDLSLFSRGAGPGDAVRPDRHADACALDVATRRGRRRRRVVDQHAQARLAAPEGPPHGSRCSTSGERSASLGLVTVCEDAGCPNLSECWADGTATFMVLGDRCTRACGFCLVDTRKPEAPAADEPDRVAEAIDRMALDHVVLTMVARDDLADGGMAHVAACVEAIRRPAAAGASRDVDLRRPRRAMPPWRRCSPPDPTC